MAPGFFSKLVRNSSGHRRDRSDPSGKSSNTSPSPDSGRSRALSSTFGTGTTTTRNTSPSEFGGLKSTSNSNLSVVKPQSRVPSLVGHDNASDSSSLVNPNFTIVPPSPRSAIVNGLPGSEGPETRPVLEGLPASGGSTSELNGDTKTRSRTTSSSPSSKRLTKSRPTTPSSSTPSLPQTQQVAQVDSSETAPPVPPLPAEKETGSNPGLSEPEVRKMSSNRSLNISTSNDSNTNGAHHSRAATTPVYYANGQVDDMTPIVESPTTEYPPPTDDLPTPMPSAKSATNGPGSSFLTASPQRDSDAVSIRSTNTNLNASPPSTKKKETSSSKPWRRQPSSRPSGLASAIAASGLAMANPALGSQHHAQLSPPAIQALGRTGTNVSTHSRKSSHDDNVTPYILDRRGSSSSTQFSPSRSNKSRRSSIGSSIGHGKRNRRRPSVSIRSDNGLSENTAAQSPTHTQTHLNVDGYYSGLDSSDSEDEDGASDEDEDEDDMASAIDVHDMPVTGFAVASSRRNADFHELFRSIPEGDYLIEDYGCALQREILIQGRLYISENHICFHANILGWITDLSIPIDEIISLEKKMTAFVIPNAILITTRQAKYSFASFLSRDTTYDVIYNIWRLVRPEGTASGAGGTTSVGSDYASIASGSREGGLGSSNLLEGTVVSASQKKNEILENKVTYCKCGKEGKHYSETAMNTVIPGTPEKIHNLMFTSGFFKDFLVGNQKLIDLQMSDWTPAGSDNHLSRTMSYIKPLNGAVGPRQTKCEIRDEVEHIDFAPSSSNAYSTTLTTTRTPDVPSGGAFSIKTRTCITYASAISSRVIVTTQVEWTGRSFIKGLIEKGAIDGQKTYHADLEKAMGGYIREHQGEFIPEGVKLDAVAVGATKDSSEAVAGGGGGGGGGGEETNVNGNVSPSSANANGEKPARSSRGLQWAWETIEGTWGVAKTSTEGALELLGDIIPSPSSFSVSTTSALYLIIFVLVVSNLWTWMRVPKEVVRGGSTRKHWERMREEMRERERTERDVLLKEEREDRERWIHGVVTALWDELAAGKGPFPVQMHSNPNPPTPRSMEDVQVQIGTLYKSLDDVEERMKGIREVLGMLRESHAQSAGGDGDENGNGKSLGDMD